MARVPSEAAAVIGERIRSVRLHRGMTQDEVGVLSGIDSSNIRAFETGRATPSVGSLVRIAAALETTPGTLLDDLAPELFNQPRRRAQ